MANGVVLDSQLDEYRRCLKASNRWRRNPIMSLVLMVSSMALGMLVTSKIFGRSIEDDSLFTSLALAVVATIPVAVFLFWTSSSYKKIERMGTKLINDYLGDGWLPAGAKLDCFNGKVRLTLENGQQLESTIKEIFDGRGRWATSKQVALGYRDALEWYAQDPPASTTI